MTTTQRLRKAMHYTQAFAIALIQSSVFALSQALIIFVRQMRTNKQALPKAKPVIRIKSTYHPQEQITFNEWAEYTHHQLRQYKSANQ